MRDFRSPLDKFMDSRFSWVAIFALALAISLILKSQLSTAASGPGDKFCAEARKGGYTCVVEETLDATVVTLNGRAALVVSDATGAVLGVIPLE